MICPALTTGIKKLLQQAATTKAEQALLSSGMDDFQTCFSKSDAFLYSTILP